MNRRARAVSCERTPWSMLLLIALGIVAAGVLLGCQGSDGDGATGSLQPNAESAARFGGFRMAPPSLEQVKSAVALTEDQTARMAVALGDWDEAIARRQEERRASRAEDQRGRAWPGDRSFSRQPMPQFLLAASDVLTVEQFVALTELLAAQKEDRAQTRRSALDKKRDRIQRSQEDSRPRGERILGEFSETLNLSEMQQNDIEQAFAAMREQMRALRDARRSDWRDTREESRTTREALDARIREILTDEQYRQLEESRSQRRDERRQQIESFRRDRLSDRLEFLTEILDLNTDQLQQVRSILTRADAERTGLWQPGRGKVDDRAVRREAFDAVRDRANEQIRDVLSAEQEVVYQALRNLEPEGRGPRFQGAPQAAPSGGNGRQTGMVG